MSSATGGYLTPQYSTDDAVYLRRLLQSIIVGVTALQPSLVRPMWQPDPPPVPSISTDWCGFAIVAQRHEKGSFHEQFDESGAVLWRHEELDVLCAFYGPNCLTNAAVLRDGLEGFAQNREVMALNILGIGGFSDIVHAPELVNDRYFDRADITMVVRRELGREYEVLPFLHAQEWVKADRGESVLAVERLISQQD